MEERVPTPPNALASLVLVAVAAFFLSLLSFGVGRMINWTYHHGGPAAWARVRTVLGKVERRLARYTFTRRIFFALTKATPHDMGFWLYKNYATEASESVPPPPSDKPPPGKPKEGPEGEFEELDVELDRVLKQLASMARTRALLESTDKERLLASVDKIRKLDGQALNQILEAVDRLRLSRDARKKLARSILSRKNVKKAMGMKDEDILFVFRDMDLERIRGLMKDKGARALELHVKERKLREDLARRREEEAQEVAEEEREQRKPPEYFTALFEDWRRHSSCMDNLARLDRLIGRHGDRLPPTGSDLAPFQEKLKEQGFVQAVVTCPDGGRYDLDGRRSICTKHGNQDRGHERVGEYKEFLFPYLRLRDGWAEAAKALGPEGEKARAALRKEIGALLKSAPHHPFAHELMGRILVAERKWSDALPHLRVAHDAFVKNRLVAYQLALALAATGKTGEVAPLLERAATAPFEALPKNLPHREAWYVLGDRCALFLKEAAKGSPFPEIEKKLAAPMPAALCHEKLSKTCERLRAWAKTFPEKSRQLARIVDRLRRVRKEHDAISPNDVDRRPRRQKLAVMARRLEEKRRACLDDRSAAFFSKELALWLKDEKIPTCPAGGRYGLTDGGALECSAHPGLVQGNWVGPLFKKLGDKTLARANRGLLLGQLQNLPGRRRCYLIQRKLDETAARWKGERMPTLEEILRGARLRPEQASCPEGGRWTFERVDGRVRTRCSKHGRSEDWLVLDATFLERRSDEGEEER